MNNIMVDEETLGKTPGHAILAIGAVRFDAGGLYDEFYTTIDIRSCLDVGLNIDGDTFLWWLKQSDEARKQIHSPAKKALSLPQALLEFNNWVGADPKVWGNGASFDNSFLAVAYERCGITPAWPFWNDKCYRTIRGLWKHAKVEPKIPHHALYDAIAQAETLVQIQLAHPEASIL